MYHTHAILGLLTCQRADTGPPSARSKERPLSALLTRRNRIREGARAGVCHIPEAWERARIMIRRACALNYLIPEV